MEYLDNIAMSSKMELFTVVGYESVYFTNKRKISTYLNVLIVYIFISNFFLFGKTIIRICKKKKRGGKYLKSKKSCSSIPIGFNGQK